MKREGLTITMIFLGRKCKLWGRDWKHFFSQKNDRGEIMSSILIFPDRL